MLVNVLAITGVAAIIAMIGKAAGERMASNIIVQMGTPYLNITAIQSGQTVVNIPITIENKNIFPIGVSSFFGDIYYGGVLISQISVPYGFSIASSSSGIVTVEALVNIQSIVDNVAHTVNSGALLNTIFSPVVLKNARLSVLGDSVNITIPIPETVIPIL